MDYNAQMIAREEHKRMVRSLPTVPEYGYATSERERSKQRLTLLVLRPILTALLNLVTK